jgi:sorting nexin-8
MSLFGDFPDDPPARTKQSTLFEDARPPAANRSTSSLFADDLDSGADSPWAFPTPKKAGRAQLVRSLLPATDVPESYIDTFDALIASGDRLGAGVSLDGIKRLLGESGLGPDIQSQILGIVLPSGEETTEGIGRGEFNVFLALIGLAQEGEEVTLDSVDERRRRKWYQQCFLFTLTTDSDT